MDDPFPNMILGVNWLPDSDATQEYNCFAWAVWSNQDVIWPDSLGVCQWDPALPRTDDIPTIIRFLANVGFVRTFSDAFEDGFEKIAIYALNGDPQHLARQEIKGPRKGYWTSKLGEGGIDAYHPTLKVLEGPKYGNVVAILKREFKGPPNIPTLVPGRPRLINPDGSRML